jgi:hypothetical protein
MTKQSKTHGTWRSQLGWLTLIWAASVGALGIVAFGMKALMRAAGLGA